MRANCFDKFASFSYRERQVIELAARGLTDKQIASKLEIRVGTIATYWNRLRSKLSVSSRSEIIARVIEARAAEEIERAKKHAAALQIELQQLRDAEHRSFIAQLDKNLILVSAIPDLILVLDSEMRLTSFSCPPGFQLPMDLSKSIDQSVSKLFPHIDDKSTNDDPQTSFFEMQIAGTTRTYESRLSQCNCSRTIIIIRDVTDAKQKERTARTNETRIRLAAGMAQLGTWEFDIDRDEVYLSPEWKANFGFSDHEIPATKDFWISRLHPEDIQSSLNSVNEFLQSGRETYLNRYRILHKAGHYVWMESVATLDTSFGTRKLFGYTVNITRLASVFGVNLDVDSTNNYSTLTR